MVNTGKNAGLVRSEKKNIESESWLLPSLQKSNFQIFTLSLASISIVFILKRLAHLLKVGIQKIPRQVQKQL
jgi:hypothetical protein